MHRHRCIMHRFVHMYSTVSTRKMVADGAVPGTGVKIQIDSIDGPSGTVYITISKESDSCTGIAKSWISTTPRSDGSYDMNSGTNGTAISKLLTAQRMDPRAMAIVFAIEQSHSS